jgi:hypothetical protein
MLNQGESVSSLHPCVPDALQSILGVKLLAFHDRELGLGDREHADIGVVHFAVEFPVTLVKAAELRIGLQQCLDIITLLVFEHERPPRNASGRVTGAPVAVRRMRIIPTPMAIGAETSGFPGNECMRQVSDPRGADAAWMTDATPASQAPQGRKLACLMQ